MMAQTGSPVAYINGTQCHVKFIYDYIVDKLNQQSLAKHELSTLKNLRKKFKEAHSERYRDSLVNKKGLDISQDKLEQ